MKKLVLSLLIIAGILEARISIVTGGKGGTYYPFGQQISKECGDTVGGLDVVSTSGSLDNIYRLLKEPNVKFAIAQYDALLYVLNNGSEEDKQKVGDLRVLMPLYQEGIHLIVRKDIDMSDIKNAFKNLRVSVGKKGSGTFVTAKNFAKITGIRWKKTYAQDVKTSIKQIVNGELDALFYVAGAPAKLFNVDESNDKIFNLYKDHLKIVDLASLSELKKFYSNATISLKDYKWMDQGVSTKSVRSVLITYNYKPFQPSYTKVKRLYQCLYKKLNKFQTSSDFHPKWQEVDPTDFRGINWEIHPAVQSYLRTLESNYDKKEKPSVKSNDKDKALDNFFKDM